MMLAVRSGIDLVDIDRLAALAPAIRERFIQRVFTPQEIIEAANSDASLAGRFAAKEAVSKALGTGIGKVSWKDIEILSGVDKQPRLVLYRQAQSIAADLGLTQWSVSISHTNKQAVAVAVAIGDSQSRPDENIIPQ